MRQLLAITALALSLTAPTALAHGALHGAQSAQPVIITSEDLGDGIHMLQGRGGNIGILTGPDGTFVIDSQYGNIAENTLAKIEEISGDAPRFLVNTHWHGDHTGGNAAYNAEGATILAHDNVRARVSTKQTRIFAGQERVTEASDPTAWPVITFPDEMTLHLNGQTIRLIHLPTAHTDGDTAVYFEQADVLHMGDVMFSGMWPYIDRSSGGTVSGYINALDAAYKLAGADTKVIPGHGGLSTREDIKALADMLREAQSRITLHVADGDTLDDILEVAPLSDMVDKWATSFMTEPRFTEILYEDAVAGAE